MLKINRMIQVEALYTAFERTYQENYRNNGERHHFWEVLYVVDGVLGVAEDERIYRLPAGSMLVHMPMEFHRVWAEDGCVPTLLVVTFEISAGAFQVLGNGVYQLTATEAELLRKVVAAACVCREYDDAIQNQLSALYLEEFLLSMLQNSTSEDRLYRTRGTQNYQKIVRVMNENLYRNLSAPEIAALCNLSLSNLKKIFKTYSGTGVMNYFNSLRMMKAIELMNRGLSIAELSEALGFSSPSYFSDAFKRYSGRTPSEYRRHYITNVTSRLQV